MLWFSVVGHQRRGHVIAVPPDELGLPVSAVVLF
jgi:hypothetical protein